MSTDAMKMALEALEGVMDFRHDSAGMIRGGNYLQKDAVESALRRALSAQPPADGRLRMSLRADLATESLAVDDLLRAMGEEPEQYRTEGGAVNRPRLLAWLKDRASPPVRERLTDREADMLQALRRAVLALAFAAETSPAMMDDYKAVSAAIERATGGPTG